MDIAIMGYACGAGGRIPGAERGPAALRGRDLARSLEELGHTVADRGDTFGEPSGPSPQFSQAELLCNNLPKVYWHCLELGEKVEQALGARQIPVVLGGDHSLSIGSIGAHARYNRKSGQKIGALWIDTHPDIHTPETSARKNLHGMPVAVLLGRVPGALLALQSGAPALVIENMVYVGLRDIDSEERSAIKGLGVRAHTMKEVDRYGIGRVIEEAIGQASAGTSGVVVSFDLDVCDPSLVPGTGTPMRGGLTFREAHLSMELIADSKKLLGLELVELNPSLDRESQTADLGASLIASALGKSLL